MKNLCRNIRKPHKRYETIYAYRANKSILTTTAVLHLFNVTYASVIFRYRKSGKWGSISP